MLGCKETGVVEMPKKCHTVRAQSANVAKSGSGYASSYSLCAVDFKATSLSVFEELISPVG